MRVRLTKHCLTSISVCTILIMGKETKTTINKVLRIVFIVIAAGLFLYLLVYRPVAIYLEKRNYTRAQSSLEDLLVKIEGKVGKPDQIKREQSCHYASQKFARGSRSCSVTIFALYENKNSQESTIIMNNAAQTVGSNLRIDYITASERKNGERGNIFIKSDRKVNQTFHQDLTNIHALYCGVSYSYPMPPDPYYLVTDSFQTKSPENIQIDLSCSGDAIYEHFPVK